MTKTSAQTIRLMALAWSAASANVPGPAPALAVLKRLTIDMATKLSAAGLRPMSVKVESWRRPEGTSRPADNDFLAALTVCAEPGRLDESFRCWLQWQHPHWQWSSESFPGQLAIELATMPEVAS